MKQVRKGDNLAELWTNVRPVVRLTPARKALIRRASNPRCTVPSSARARQHSCVAHLVCPACSLMTWNRLRVSKQLAVACVGIDYVAEHAHCGGGRTTAQGIYFSSSGPPLSPPLSLCLLPHTELQGTMASRPPSPPFPKGYFSAPFERFVRDDGNDQWASAFTLLG